MRTYIYIITLLISGLQLNAQNTKDFIIIEYDGYSLNYEVMNNSQECRVGLWDGYPINVTIPSSVTIEDTQYSVTSIRYEAFSNCSSLLNIEIPSSVTYIGDWAFSWCSSLEIITFQDGSQLTSIGEYAFYSCSSLEIITFQDGPQLTSIGGYAFSNCSSLLNIEIPSSVTSIGDSAFENCLSLTNIIIPNNVTLIGEGAFRNCLNIDYMYVDENNTVYDSRENCNAIIETFTNTIIVGCQNTIIPSSVTSIRNYAFAGSNLTSVEIPCNITHIGEYAFASCSNIVYISVDEGNAVYDNRENCNAIIETSTNTIIVGCQNTVIPSSVTSIGRGAFYGSSITSIEIPHNVTSVGRSAFSHCLSLLSIEIPSSVTSIGVWAFSHCLSLKTVTFEKDSQFACIEACTFEECPSLKTVTFEGDSQLTSIEGFAFSGCSSLNSIDIPIGVKSIGDWAFSKCSSLKTITSYPITVPATDFYTFFHCPEDMTIYVPVESLNDYESTSPWNEYDIRPIGTNVEEISMSFNIYPNPVTNILYIDTEEIIEEVVVYNVNGHPIYNEQCKMNNVQLDVSNINAGFYFVKIRINGNETVRKIIKT